MDYIASQKLINILLKYGFKEATQDYFPSYYQIIKEQNEYDPSSIRLFSYDNIMVYFDAAHLKVTVNKQNAFKTDAFTEEELQSLLFPLVFAFIYEEYVDIVDNPVYLISFIKKLIESSDLFSETEKEKYQDVYNKIKSIDLTL